MSAKVYETPAGPIEARVVGEGPAVLIIHGTPGSWRQTFSLEEDVAGAYAVVSPSRPGYGRTPISTGRTPSEQAGAYAALLDELGIDRCVVVGASGGGPSALAFAREHAERTFGLMLVCAMSIEHIKVPVGLRLLVPRGFGEVLSGVERTLSTRRLASQAAIDKSLSKLHPDEQRRVAADPSIRSDLIRFARTHLEAPAGLIGIRNDHQQLLAIQSGRAPWGFDGIVAPTLVMHGADDDVCPLDHAEYHVNQIDGAHLEVYKDCGHVFLITRRADVNARARRFIDEVVG